MKIVIAIDSFKGSLSSLEAAECIRRGILSADQEAQIEAYPLADGGEGTVEALSAALSCHPVTDFSCRGTVGVVPQEKTQTAVVGRAAADKTGAFFNNAFTVIKFNRKRAECVDT